MDKNTPDYNYNLIDLKLDVLKIKYAFLDDKWKEDRVCSSYSRIYIPTSGEGQLFYNGKTVKLIPGNIYIVPSSLVFSYKCDYKLEKFYIHFKLIKPDGIDAFSTVKDCLVLENMPEIASLLDKALLSKGVTSAVKVQSVIYQIIDRMISFYNLNFAKADNLPRILEDIIEFVNKNLTANFTIDQIVNEFYLSRSTVQKIFKKHVNMPLGKYVDDRILAEGERLLLTTNYSIKEISDKLGFCDQFYFSRKFASYYGTSPLKHRRRNKE